jgi:cell division protein FtsN
MAQATHKARKKSSPRRSKPVPGWAWLLAGLAIGLSIAYFASMKNRAKQPPAPAVSAAPPAASKPEHTTADSKKGDKKSAKPRFDFYTILPEMEVVVPDARNKAGQSMPIDKPGTYILQVASFHTYAEADNLKARLALLGVESKIESVTVNNTDTWHRVRVGPYQDLRELNKIRTRLLNNNISAILLRLNG